MHAPAADARRRFGGCFAHRLGRGPKVGLEAPEHLDGHKLVGVVDPRQALLLILKPDGGFVIALCQEHQHLSVRHRTWFGLRLELRQRGCEVVVGRPQQFRYGLWQLPGAIEGARLLLRGRHRVVDQQDDAQSRVLLQRGSEQRLVDDPGVLAIGRNEHRERRLLILEELVDHAAGYAPVRGDAAEIADAGNQVGAGRGGEQRHEKDVDQGFEDVAAARVSGREAVELLRRVHEPGSGGYEDRQARKLQARAAW